MGTRGQSVKQGLMTVFASEGGTLDLLALIPFKLQHLQFVSQRVALMSYTPLALFTKIMLFPELPRSSKGLKHSKIT
jgi:hypothetical protein